MSIVVNLIKSAKDSVISEVKDQYLEAFSTDSLGDSVLVRRAKRKDKNGNNMASEDVISSGSKIVVPEGTCALCIDGGKVVSTLLEPGIYTWEDSSSPSILGGGSAKGIFGDAFERFKFGGEVAKMQRIYYVNMLEIRDNGLKGSAAVPYHDETYNTVYLKINIVFSFRVSDPQVFYKSVAGQSAGDYMVSNLIGSGQVLHEVGDLTTEAMVKLSDQKVGFADLMANKTEVAQKVRDSINSKWAEKRGIELVLLTLNIRADEDTMSRISQFDQAKIFGDNPDAVAAQQIIGSNNAMNTAAGNPNGAVTGFVGTTLAGGNGNQAAFDYLSSQQTVCKCPACGFVPESGKLGNYCDACGTKLN